MKYLLAKKKDAINFYCSEPTIQSAQSASSDDYTFVNNNQMPDDVFQVFPMSSTKFSTIDDTKCNIKHNDNVKEPIIIISNLKSDLDLKTLIDEIITKKEFSEASSLFVVVPSDEEENEICCDGLDSTQCIKLPENFNKWQNQNADDICLPCNRTSSETQVLKVTNQNKCFFENMPTTIISSINNEANMYNYVKRNQNWFTGNNGDDEYHVFSTDTTQDRPCCCAAEQSGACAENVMSQVITQDAFINQDVASKKTVPRKNNIQQASFVSVIQSPKLSVGGISATYQTSEQILPNPFSNSAPEHLKNYKKSLGENLNPHSMNKVLNEMELLDPKNNGSPTEYTPQDSLLRNTSITRLRHNSISFTTKAKTKTTPLIAANERYLICHQHRINKSKSPKWVSSDKAVRIDTVCDCKHTEPSFIKTEAESNIEPYQCCTVHPNRPKSFGQVISRLHRKNRVPVTRRGELISIGVQDSPGCILCLSGLPCTSENNVAGHIASFSKDLQQTPVDVYGHSNHHIALNPLRSYVAIGSGGIYTQGGSKRTHGRDTGVGVDLKNAGTDIINKSECINKEVQKNTNVIFENSSPEPKLKPRPIPRYMFKEDERGQNKITLMKPNITQTASTFDNNPASKPHVKASLTIEDIIRYYAIFKPEVLQTLISLISDKKSNENKQSLYNDEPCGSSGVPKETREQESRPFIGLKIKKAGKSLM